MSNSLRFKVKNGLDNNNNTITNVATPVFSTDAANKAYIDALSTGVSSVTGTTNQIIVTGSGAITLSLPQNINSGAAPIFNGTYFTNIPNGALVNDTITIGSTSLALGATSLTLAGLTSVTSTTFVGALTGNASTATSSTNILGGAGGSLPYQSAANTTAMLASGSSSQVLISGAAPSWTNTPSINGTNFTSIPNSALTNNSVTIGSTNITLGATATALVGLTSVTSTSFTGALTGNATSATTTAITDNTTLNATVYPTWVTGTSGNLGQETSSTKLSFNPNSGTLTATAFSGSGAGLTNIPNGAFTNNSLTIGSTNIALGSTVTTLTGLTSVVSTGFTGALTGNASSATTATTAGTLTTAQNFSATGDATAPNVSFNGSSGVALALTLATVNSSPVSAAFQKLTTNGKGLVVATSSVLPSDITTALGYTPVNKAGDTMTGALILNADPSAALGAATKQYVDAAVANLYVHGSVNVATTTNYPAIYNNGTGGVGATLTNSGTLTALVVDGVTLPLNSRVLVKNQTTTTQNGIYFLSTLGTGSVAWVLTRTLDADGSPAVDFAPGAYVFVDAGGTQNSNTGWTETAIGTGSGGTINIGTDAVVFTQFSGAGSYLAGTGLSLTGNTFANTGVLSNVAGTGISISGSTGNITITNTGVTSLVAGSNVNISGATGAVTISLPTTLSGLTSVSSTTFTGALTGNASTATLATTATNIAGGTAGSLPYQTAAGTTGMLAATTNGFVLTLASGLPVWAANTGGVTSITGTANQVIASSSTGAVTLSLPQNINSGAAPTFVGTNFTSIPNSGLTNSSLTIGSTNIALGTTATTIAGLTSVSSTTFVGALTGVASGNLPLTGGTLTGPLTVGYSTPVVAINDTSGTNQSNLEFNSSGSIVWDLVKLAGATGNFQIQRFVSGSYVDSPINISNTTGLVSIADGLTVTGTTTSTTFVGALTGNASTATTATNSNNTLVTATGSNINYPLAMVSSDVTGQQSLLVDSAASLTWNPSTDIMTTTGSIEHTSGISNAYWLSQDSSGRQHWYWNTTGSSAPVTITTNEDVMDIMMTTGNGLVATCNATISGTVMTVTSTPTANIALGDLITGVGIPTGVYVSSYGTGTGSNTGTYNLNTAVTVSTAELITFTPPAAVYTGSISGNNLTITSVTIGTINVGQYVTGSGITSGTYIVAGSGTAWQVNNSQTVSSTTLFNGAGGSMQFRTTTGLNQPAGTAFAFDNVLSLQKVGSSLASSLAIQGNLTLSSAFGNPTVGRLILPNGSAALPVVAFNGNSGLTGLYYTGANIGFTVAGTAVGNIGSTGLNSMPIGISTAANANFTTVNTSGTLTYTTATAGNQEGILLSNTNAAGGVTINFSGNNGGLGAVVGLNSAGSTFILGTTTVTPVVLEIDGTAALTITTAGGFSFGSTSTNYGTAGQVLTSNGNAAPSWSAGTGAGQMTTNPVIVATQGQTVFSVPSGYSAGLIMVFVNGSLLLSSDYTAINGTSVTLATASNAGEEVQTIVFSNQSLVASSSITRTPFTATDNQTTFSVAYPVGMILVSLGGTILPTSDYTATNGTSVVFNTGLSTGSTGEFITFTAMNITNAVNKTGDAISGVVTAPTPAVTVNNTQLATTAYVNNLIAMQHAGHNFMVNGDMGIAQRGTTYAIPAGGGFSYGSLDRWAVFATSSTGYFNQVAAPAGSGFQNIAKLGRTAGQTGTGIINTRQALESVNSYPMAGQTVVLSFYAYAGANFSAASNSMVVNLCAGTGTDQPVNAMGSWTGLTLPINQTISLTTGLVQYQFTATIPSNATQIGLRLYFTPSGTAGADDAFYVTGVQLEIVEPTNAVASNYDYLDYGIQLQECQRWLRPLSIGAVGFCTSTVNAYVYSTGIPMRNTASLISTTTFGVSSAAGANIATTAASLASRSNDNATFGIQMTVASGLVAGNGTILNGGTGYISCEL